MLNELAKLLRPGDSLKFSIVQTPAGLRVAVVPVMSDSVRGVVNGIEQADGPALQAVRAALALPLVATLDAADPDAQFRSLLSQFGAVREEAHSGLDNLLRSIKDAGRAAENTAAAKSKSATPAKERAGKPGTVPEQAAAAAQPDPGPASETTPGPKIPDLFE
ncbi:hypothetical protein E4T66_17720 [Sinimarinibacterium sp. CAU 1509]|uniref:hypothetical protein n=1 Tax=Sinimarinibacterium sp. CAU 1509 TaxID=2562283 RepID=UPI0010ABCF69|nr:hypothetical protein [Sinimarinibacterium sp. CAU 1509]TJY57246.1 hypothetical protein E4T66_17720 [Sinimarinibacterium sp. CAU 1509]